MLQFKIIAFTFFFTAFAGETKAQLPGEVPSGQPSITNFNVPVVTGDIFSGHSSSADGSDCVVNVNGIYMLNKPSNGQTYASSLWTPPSGVEIVGVWAKLTFDAASSFYVLTSDHHMHIVSLTATLDSKTGVHDCTLTGDNDLGTGSEKFNGDIAYSKGDDTYIATTAGDVWATHDDTTWRVDTTGFNGHPVTVLEVDTLQNVYAATGAGIYKQPLSGSQWQILSGSPTYATYLFRSRTNALFAANFSSLWITRDGGTTWVLDTAGMGYTQVKSICEDDFGDYYAVSSSYQYGDHVWKQTGSAPWVPVDAGLAGLQLNPTTPFLKAVAVDSGIHVATSFGTFSSYDGGTSWQLLTQGLRATNIYAFYKFSNGRRLASTELGVFTKDPGDTVWTKRFPSNSYLSGVKYAVDNSGKMYVFGVSRVTPFYQTLPPDIYVSSDRGSTWVPDTAGSWQFSGGTEFVDESGTEHLATSANQLISLYAKAPAGQWQGDSTGYHSNTGDAVSAFASDRHGSIYLAINNGTSGPRLIKRSIGGGSWSEVPTTAVLGGMPYAFTATKDGKLVGGNSKISMGYYDGTSWTLIPPPAGLSNPSGFPESVDSSNRLWVIYGNIDQNYYYTPYGTYWTSDLGQHWTKAADGSYNFVSLVSFGDTTYGLNSGKGLIAMSSDQASVASSMHPTVQVSVVPNPASDRIEFNIDAIKSNVEIYDVKGEKIVTLRGQGQIVWDLRASGVSELPNGAYLAKVSGNAPDGSSFNVLKHFIINR